MSPQQARRRLRVMRRTPRKGQAMTEVALLLPLLLLLILGVYSVVELVEAQNDATVATRNAARLASELGAGGWTQGSVATDPTAVDNKIIATVITSMTGPDIPSGAIIDEIDVYEPDLSQSPGYFSTTDGAMLIDRYTGDGAPYPGWSSQYTLDQRHDVLDNESLIGVRVVYSYEPPTQIFAWLGGQRTAYTVMQVQPS